MAIVNEISSLHPEAEAGEPRSRARDFEWDGTEGLGPPAPRSPLLCRAHHTARMHSADELHGGC